ncbi:MAG: oligosaccharide flippase family protein [Bacteroidales bacterium]
MKKLKETLNQGIAKRLEKNPLVSRMLHGGFYSILGNVFPRIFLLIAFGIISNKLGKEIYGQWGLIRPTVDTFMTFAVFGLGNTASKYIAEYRETNQEALRRTYLVTSIFSLLLIIILSLVLIFTSGLIAEGWLKTPSFKPYLLASIGMLVFSSINGLQKGVMNGLEAFKELAKNNIISICIQSVLMVVFVYLWGLYGVIIGYSIGFMTLAILNFRYIRSQLKSNWWGEYLRKLRLKDFKVLYSFSFPSALAAAVVIPVMFFSKAEIVAGNGFSKLTIIDISEQYMFMLFLIPTAVGQVALPLLSNILSKGGADSKRKYWKMLLFNIAIGSGAIFIAAIILSLFSEFILSFYAKGVLTQNIVFILFLFAAVFRSVCTVVGQAILSRAITWMSLLFNLIWAALFLGLLFGLPLYLDGALRYAWAFFGSYGVYMCIQISFLFFIYRKEKGAFA